MPKHSRNALTLRAFVCCTGGLQFAINGRIVQPGDDIVFVRKDLADQNGLDSDPNTGVGDLGLSYGDGASNAQSCAQAISNSLPTSQTDVPPDGSANEFGGTVAAECKNPPTQAGCDPATCQVWPQNAK